MIDAVFKIVVSYRFSISEKPASVMTSLTIYEKIRGNIQAKPKHK